MIQWRRVTWYSKALALATFIIFPFAGFYFGIQIGGLLEAAKAVPVVQILTSTLMPQAGDEYYSNVAEWQSGSYPQFGFSVAYPIDFDVNEWTAQDSANSAVGWRLNANGAPGATLLTINIPKAFEPHTNFAEAQLAIGRSNNAQAIRECLAPDPNGGIVATSTMVINGVSFLVSNSADAGAGNYYETTSHRAIHAGYCYAVEYTIHSAQIANYPASYDLQQFDKAKAKALLEGIVGTFKFL